MSHFALCFTAIMARYSMSIVMPSAANDRLRIDFKFNKTDAAQTRQPVDDGVMGGVSAGRFKFMEQGTMAFFGKLSLENNKVHAER